MLKLTLTAGLLAATIGLAACDRRPSEPDVPKAEIEQSERAALLAYPSSDPSLPPASVALNRNNDQALAGPPATLHVAPLPPVSESVAMPLGGQNNDHSAPKSTDPVPAKAPASPLR
ncbi:hypothetical protein [Piscinibacter sakaiensis]|uniref:hypothetical protein n=1 Tax=Piscinibacter sakaiensis TaxID=1547922 RepID=UPI003AAAC9E8